MNLLVEYVNFSAKDWFGSTPGILVTIGFVLVVIGAIVLLVSGKKKEQVSEEDSKEEVKENVPVENAPEIVASNNVENVAVAEEKKSEQVIVPAAEPAVEAISEPAVEVASEPAVEVISEPAVEVISEPAVEAISEPAVEAILEPAVEAISEPAVEVISEPAVEAISEPAVEVVPEPAVEVVSSTNNNTVSIYGGANPQVSVKAPEEPRKAYGGADPLENTGALPRVEVPSEPVEESAPEILEVETKEEIKEVKLATATPNDDVETLEF